MEVVHQAAEYSAAEGLTKTWAASESTREWEVAAVGVEVEERPRQAEDQNGSDLELDTIHEAYQNSRTARSFGGPCIGIESPLTRGGGISFVSATG